MTQQPGGPYQPSRREVLRPAEYVGGAAIAAIFVGVITLAGTRDWTITLIGAGAVFIVVLVVLALLQMAVKPDASERAELDQAEAERPERLEPRDPDTPPVE
ncbi:ABC transporter ATP-binding protein [Agromyces sp. CFH 90414]|uniref:ABC transporter ATP-binding protein n=1 Tax=Agromyces agglutinans TaxID=2662258 RepID=A0A6I2F8B6_9MICO|nr:ABC transporter ATP-binding protein [Agromyces agglutinans]MRG59020.1 ABC transporter ATP-binding protein [Agromyces agglutinans]